MSSSTSEKFNRLVSAKEAIRKAINKKGGRVSAAVPFEQYATKIDQIQIYELPEVDPDAFNNFINNYYNNTERAKYNFYQDTTLANLNDTTLDYLKRMGIAHTKSLYQFCYGATNLQAVGDLTLIGDTCMSAYRAFYGCTKLTDVTQFKCNSINLTSIDSLFYQCSALKNVKLDIYTEKALAATNMFYSCNSLQNLDIVIESQNSIDASYFFYQLYQSTLDRLVANNSKVVFRTPGLLNLSYFLHNSDSTTSKVSNISGLLDILDLTEVGKINLYAAFNRTRVLTTTAGNTAVQTFINSLDLNKVTNMAYMFTYSYSNENFTNLDLTINLPDTNLHVPIYYMFSCDNSYTYASSIVSNFTCTSDHSAASLFKEYGGNLDYASYHPLKSITRVSLPNISNTARMFYCCSYLERINAFETGPNLRTVYIYSNESYTPQDSNFEYYALGYSYSPDYGMFYNCKRLTYLPAFDTSNCISFKYMFYNCIALTEVPAFDLGGLDTVINSSYKDYWHTQSYSDWRSPLYYMVYGCSNLTAFHCTNIKGNLDLSYSTKFTREALLEVIGNLVNTGYAMTLHIGSTNLAKLTEEDIAIATEKGWTIN